MNLPLILDTPLNISVIYLYKLFIILVYHIIKFVLKVASELYTGKSLSSSFTNYRYIIIKKYSKENKEEKTIF